MKTETKINIVAAIPVLGMGFLVIGIFIAGLKPMLLMGVKLLETCDPHKNLSEWNVLGLLILPLALYGILYLTLLHIVGKIPAIDGFPHQVYCATENWFYHRRRSVYKCLHNGVIGITTWMDFHDGQRAFQKLVAAGKATYPKNGRCIYDVKNVMTFSDDPRLAGKVSGNLADLATLEKDCWIGDGSFMVPGTSGFSSKIQSLSFEEGYRLVHGHSPKKQ